MLKRIKQFYSALKNEFSFADALYVREHLTYQQALLFFQMGILEQKHAVQVAQTLEELLAGKKIPVDEKLLVQAALLHDIGKVNGSMKLWHKVAAVLLDNFDPPKARARASFAQPKGSLAYALYVYYYHPRIGARKLESLGEDFRLCALVRLHHSKNPPPEFARELFVLQKADELN